MEAARAYRAGKFGRVGGGPVAADAITPCVTVLVKNITGADLDAGAVVKVGNQIADIEDQAYDVRRKPLFVGTTPGASTDPFAVLIDPVKSGFVGRAAVSGVVLTKVSGTGGYATPTASQSYLTSATNGPARVLQPVSGSGAQPAVVLIGGQGGSGLVYYPSCAGGFLTVTVVPAPTAEP